MPWCGYWGAMGTHYWWVLPLIGLVFIAVMFFACFRGFRCMGGWRRSSSMMQQMMERMRSTGECSSGAMCQRMMASFRMTSEGEAETTPEPPTSPEERARSEDGELRHGCCGQQPVRAPKGT